MARSGLLASWIVGSLALALVTIGILMSPGVVQAQVHSPPLNNPNDCSNCFGGGCRNTPNVGGVCPTLLCTLGTGAWCPALCACFPEPVSGIICACTV
jgi:hypothetical protein